MKRSLQILGIGKYLPSTVVTAADIDTQLDMEPGTAYKKSGVMQRYHAKDEAVTSMGAKAGLMALEDAGLALKDIEAIVYVGATGEQGIPCNAVTIQKALGAGLSGITCFDLDATCLSFVLGLDMMSLATAAGRFKRVLLISAERGSTHLNPKHLESYCLFGDGAAAWVIAHADDPKAKSQPSEILLHQMESYGEYNELCEIKGGMSRLPAFEYSPGRHGEFCFHMEGRRLFKITAQIFPDFLQRVLAQANVCLDDIDWFIPHQASGSALELMRKRLEIPEPRYVRIIESHGNQVSASIPTAFFELQRSGRLRKGQLVLIMGTGAGLSVGALLLRY